MTSIKYKTDSNGTTYTFPNGVTLTTLPQNGSGRVTYPATDKIGSFGFPVRFSGDCFHALKQGLPIPDKCKAW